MKLKLVATALVALSLGACNKGGDTDTSDIAKPADQIDKVSYTIGFQIGSNLGRDSIKVNEKYFLAGLQEGMKYDTTTKVSKLTMAEMEAVMKQFQEEMQKKQMQKMQDDEMKFKAKGEKLKTEGAKFLEANKTKPGVITTKSGLQYRIITKGTGKIASKDDMVKVNLIGKFTDGTEFDNTYKREPVDIPVGGLIPGWQEALLMMPEGSKWELVIPSELGYGEKGAGMTIPPNAVLVFELEVVKNVGKAPKQQMPQMGK